MLSSLIVLCFLSSSISASQTGVRAPSEVFPFEPGFDIRAVVEQARKLPSHSWEYGTAAQALLELYTPELSVFGSSPFSAPSSNPNEIPSLAYAAEHINTSPESRDLVGGDGAAGDPASLGVSAILLGKSDQKFAAAAKKQFDRLNNPGAVPRFDNGAISHRESVPELWADFMYMAPPFMAYYAADTKNAELLKMVVEQCKLYRDVLKSKQTGAWQHIVGPESSDPGLWSTGNAWAAAGMARVLATVVKAPVAGADSEKLANDLTSWIKEIVDEAMTQAPENTLLKNYWNEDAGAKAFEEVAGSSLLAAVTYRMAVLRAEEFGAKYVGWADGIRSILTNGSGPGNATHITEDGIARPSVNPLDWNSSEPFESGSPEANAFVVLMYAAWRDCVIDNKCTQSSSRRMRRARRRLQG